MDGGRQAFRPGEPVVAVRHVRLDGNTLLAPGDLLPDWCAPHHVLGLFRRSVVGMLGCPWTDHQLRFAGVAPTAPAAPIAELVEASAQETSEAAG